MSLTGQTRHTRCLRHIRFAPDSYRIAALRQPSLWPKADVEGFGQVRFLLVPNFTEARVKTASGILKSNESLALNRCPFALQQFWVLASCGELLFGRILPRMSPDLRADVSLRLQAYDTDAALGRITLEPSVVPVFTRCVREMLAATEGAEMLAATVSKRASAAFDELRKAVA